MPDTDSPSQHAHPQERAEDHDELLDRWLSAQAVLAPMLKDLFTMFQGEGHALMLLTQNETATMSPSALARMMDITTGRASNLLRQLESKGLINRHRGAADLRAVAIDVTPDGKRCAQEAYAQAKAQTESLLGLLDADDARELVRIIEQLARARSATMPAEKPM